MFPLGITVGVMALWPDSYPWRDDRISGVDGEVEA